MSESEVIWIMAGLGTALALLSIGTCILIVPQRNPLVLAKELATLDHLSKPVSGSLTLWLPRICL